MTKISALPEDTAPTTDDWVASVDNTSGSTKKVKWINIGSMLQSIIMPFMYPINSVYIETSGTNPATTFGFGTWSAYAQGAALVGVAATGTFATAGSVVGSETHAVTVAEMPSHAHSVYDPTHTHYSVDPGQGQVAIAAGSTNKLTTSGGAQQITWGNATTSPAYTGIGVNANGGGAAMSLVQPSLPVYVWRRTA